MDIAKQILFMKENLPLIVTIMISAFDHGRDLYSEINHHGENINFICFMQKFQLNLFMQFNFIMVNEKIIKQFNIRSSFAQRRNKNIYRP